METSVLSKYELPDSYKGLSGERQEDIEHFHMRDEAVTAITSYVYVF